MPTSGAYEFKLAPAAKEGLIEDEMKIEIGEWAWVEKEISKDRPWKAIYAKCPDCRHLMTLWRGFGSDRKGHVIDGSGNVSPSVLHSYVVGGMEQCGFHTMPTKLLDFIDRRKS